MQIFYISTLLSFFLSGTLAAPGSSPIELVPRACATRSPSIYIYSAANPNDLVQSGDTQVKREGPPYKNTVATFLSFNGFPDGATGCQLKFIIPKTSHPVATANPDYSSAFNADVFLLKAGRIPTWNTPPARNQKVSSIQFPTTATTSVYETILWAGNCPSNNVPRDGPYASQLQFSIEASDWQQLAGSAKLYNSVGTSGFSIIYNC